MRVVFSLEDPDRSCKVACQDEKISHRFYLVNGEGGWFPFGTECNRDTSDKKAYCISGKCLVSVTNVCNFITIKKQIFRSLGKMVHQFWKPK